MPGTECEIRFFIRDIKNFNDDLSAIDNEVIKEYSFTDHVFRPIFLTEEYLEFEKIMRIRDWKHPLQISEVLFSKITLEKVEDFIFKRSLFPNGKVKLFSGTLDVATKILHELYYEPWFNIEKINGKLIMVKAWDFSFVLEEIKNMGYTVEIEVWDDDFEKVKEKFTQIVEVLKLNKEHSNPHPLPWFYYHANKEKIQKEQVNL